jgi:hypothetical protein
MVFSDLPTFGLVEAVEREWERAPVNLDLRVVRYAVAAAPTRASELVCG